MSMTVGDSSGQKTTVAEIKGRGRAVVASKLLRAGEVVLRDSPILLYSAFPLNHHIQQQQEQGRRPCGGSYCSHCFRILLDPSSVVSCPFCSSSTTGGGVDHAAVLFCGPTCRSAALDSSHTRWVCQSLSRLRDCPSLLHHPIAELQIQARFLVAAYNLSRVSPSDFQTLLCLQGDSRSIPDDAALFLHSLISSLCPPPPPPTHKGELCFTSELTTALLAKDKLNAFGLMEPFGDGERSVRAYGIYPNASFFNHDCLPNACRFDYLDAANESSRNTDIVVRLIHDVPQGREICLSYFPVNLNYSERQRRLKEDYGFSCTCDRCNVEANWSDNEEEEEEEEAMDEDHDELMVDSAVEVKEEEESDFPHAYFFLRYMCSRENCWGTLAPLPPLSNGTSSSVMECNVCGNLKKNDDEGGIDGDSALAGE